MSATICTLALSGCDLGKTTVNTTSKVLERAAPAIEQESDYEMAARALPGSLKTVEGFWYVHKDNPRLIMILAKGYCQYGTGFVEDEWEQAMLARDLDAAAYHSTRATKMFVRCTNYALRKLGKKWRDGIFADFDTLRALLDQAKPGQRDAMMWAGYGLAATINQNKDNIVLVSQLPSAKLIMEKVVEIDDQTNNQNIPFRVLPHMALGLINSAQGAALGGKPEKAKEHFMRAHELSGGKFLLAKVMLARRYAVMIQDRQLFRKTLIEVIQTSPDIWPEQRLANEIAHRRARRYLKHEKEWF